MPEIDSKRQFSPLNCPLTGDDLRAAIGNKFPASKSILIGQRVAGSRSPPPVHLHSSIAPQKGNHAPPLRPLWFKCRMACGCYFLFVTAERGRGVPAFDTTALRARPVRSLWALIVSSSFFPPRPESSTLPLNSCAPEAGERSSGASARPMESARCACSRLPRFLARS